ncbi:DNA cytosine methyltransferase [Rhodovulum sp. P5]|uniref:DNA cytosine methyltransferase n=1 Tax=Rhodovulum sp. P5 TaxID=1564506 RepID=UPI0009DA6CE9|nr:DNA cytosine methyltransferase [Rhodovulum sp. P5]
MSIDVFDFFSGCGGTSKGFELAGLRPVFALDFDEASSETFRCNFPDVEFYLSDITQFDSRILRDLIDRKNLTLFCGCAPCQPFTRQNTRKPESQVDPRRSLLTYFGALVARYLPDYVFVENVPGMQRIKGNSTLNRFSSNLDKLGYSSRIGIVESQGYGVPQRRRRLVLLATRHGSISFPRETHGSELEKPYATVRDWISDFPPIAAGETHPDIPNHQAANLSEINLKRIMATPPEGSRSDWPEELHLDCHKSGYSGHTDVYGRMRWDGPATGLTTRCISLSNGRFGHPEQNRAISIREAASLQTFPTDFRFFGSLGSQAKQIGNAVPVLLAKTFGAQIADHAAERAG